MVGQIEFTGIVVTYNEERRLKACLTSLKFCEQLIVIDLGSTDFSVEIARECGAEIIRYRKVPIVEEIRQRSITYARNNWIVFLDPDEVFPPNVDNMLRSMIALEANLGALYIPLKFYFMGKPLDCTIWGGYKSMLRVIHKDRNRLASRVHGAIEALSGYTSAALSAEVNGHIRHYWVDSYRQMFEKHRRYIKKEGEARYYRGWRFTWKRWVFETIEAIKYNLIDCEGLYNGFNGIFLSFFYGWYVNMSLLSLRKYQKDK